MIKYFKIIHQKNLFSSVPEGANASCLLDFSQHHNTIIFIAEDDAHLMQTANLLAFHNNTQNTKQLIFPAWDCLPYDRVSPNPHIISERLQTLCNLCDKSNDKVILLTTINAITQRTPPKEYINKASLTLKIGNTLPHDKLVAYLIDNGYQRVSSVTEPGEFAVRGHIIDIYPAGEHDGYRIDFFGDEIETIRVFDPFTQISAQKKEQLFLYPASEILLNKETIQRFREKYRSHFGSVAGDDPLYDAISAGRKYVGMEHWLPLFYNKLDTIFDYIENPLIVCSFNIQNILEERLSLINEYYTTRKEYINKKSSYLPLPAEQLYLKEEEWHGLLNKSRTVDLSPFSTEQLSGYDYHVELPYKNTPAFSLESQSKKNTTPFTLLKEFVSNNSDKVIFLHCFSDGSRERIARMLQAIDIKFQFIKNHQEAKNPNLYLTVTPLEQGYITDKYCAISEQELLGKKLSRNTHTRRKRSIEHFIQEASSLMPGEYVVHKEHGIAKFENLETLDISGQPHDFILLIYANDDKLYVPIENIDTISRYGTSEGVRLDKLGHSAWQGRKAQLKKRIQIAAEELLRIAAERQVQSAPTLIPLRSMYDEFCARFPYAETDDQLRSIEEIEEDLQSGHPMDRLVCGDVGFGKTEVALRAAFIAISSEHKAPIQVAVVAPTTLLARQHFLTFQERFAGFPVKVRQLSRLVSSADAKLTREEIKEGNVDIIIGTHALLAKSLKFKNLGLLIIDEEQHFGVAQKEQLKSLKENVHVITLTATPIPRTLQMSLSGIKTLSLIATPPIDRLAVRTYVMPFDPVIIREAILREHHRGGQSFYVCPRIADLENIYKKITELVPEIKVVKAHGQMASTDLEKIMQDFYDRKFDMLLSTTIIESGLDVPAANTMFIHRADMFGLSQLYQLRGRVGRGKIRAYAYLTLPQRQQPTKEALKRLEVMQSLDSLGAGFSVASHDMDIRGFGNLVGEAQSGHIREVGIELYQDMLKEAVEEAKQRQSADKLNQEVETADSSWSPTINLGIPVLIPDSYISDLELRLGLYRRLSYLATEEEIEAFATELIDRFGPIPQEVEYLLSIMKLKKYCKKANIEKIDMGPKGVTFSFKDNHFSNPEKLLEFINQRKPLAKLRPDQKLVLIHNWNNADEKLKGIQLSLKDITKLAA